MKVDDVYWWSVPDNLDFEFKWDGSEDVKNLNTPFWHQPGIFDGGYVVTSDFNPETQLLAVFWCTDTFVGNIVNSGITIPIEKDKVYHIHVRDNTLSCDEGSNPVDMEELRKASHEALMKDIAKFIRENFNDTKAFEPHLVRNQMFSEFAMESAHDAVTYFKPPKEE